MSVLDLNREKRYSPELKKRLRMYEKALSGDLVWSVTPATVASDSSASGGWTRTVVVKLVDSAGDVHTWFNKAITTGVSIADTSSAGTASIPSTTLTLVNGATSIVVTGDDAAWADAETDTLTVAQATILGYTVAAATSVETFSDPA